jgi:hypothetical protein
MQSKEEVQQQMFDKIGQWRMSGLSQKAFCEQSNLSYHIFHYWYKRYRSQSNEHTNSSFVKLQPVASPLCTANIEVVWPDGKRLLFHHDVSSDYLKALIS